jgi:hypothetical protein
MPGPARPVPQVQLAGLGEAWQLGEPSERRALLMSLFDGLVVGAGRIVEVLPRPNRTA